MTRTKGQATCFVFRRPSCRPDDSGSPLSLGLSRGCLDELLDWHRDGVVEGVEPVRRAHKWSRGRARARRGTRGWGRRIIGETRHLCVETSDRSQVRTPRSVVPLVTSLLVPSLLIPLASPLIHQVKLVQTFCACTCSLSSLCVPAFASAALRIPSFPHPLPLKWGLAVGQTFA